MEDILYGRNVARETLRARRRHVRKVIIADRTDKSAVLQEIQTLAKKLKIQIRYVPRQQLDQVGRDHQGVALEVGNYPFVDIRDILKRAEKAEQPPFVLVLDHITDPQNFGAVLRTAEAVGVHGVIIPKQRAAGITPTVVKASAGASEHIWIAQVPNLVQALNTLKSKNVWVAGVEEKPDATRYDQANLSGAMALVIGSEGKGISRLVRKNCDFAISFPMQGQIESLNASVATALALYEVWRAREFQTIK